MQLAPIRQFVVVDGPVGNHPKELLVFFDTHNQLVRRLAQFFLEVLEHGGRGAAVGNVHTLGLPLEEAIFVN